MNIVPSIADPIRASTKEKGALAAAAEYRRLRAEKPEDYDFSETELNRLGYEFLHSDRPADAVSILKLNAEAFPHSPNAADSLREACAATGDRAGAMAAAKRVLELLESDVSLPAPFRDSLKANARKTLEEPRRN